MDAATGYRATVARPQTFSREIAESKTRNLAAAKNSSGRRCTAVCQDNAALVSKAHKSVNPFLQEPVRQRKKTVSWFVWFVSFIWFVSFVWLNQTDQMNQINKTNQLEHPGGVFLLSSTCRLSKLRWAYI